MLINFTVTGSLFHNLSADFTQQVFNLTLLFQFHIIFLAQLSEELIFYQNFTTFMPLMRQTCFDNSSATNILNCSTILILVACIESTNL